MTESGDEVYVLAASGSPPKTEGINPFSPATIGEPKLGTGTEGPQPGGQKVEAIDNRLVENTMDDQPYELKEVSTDDEIELNSFQQKVVPALGGLFLSSVVVLAQASQNCENASKCESWDAYAVALGCVSTLISLGTVLTIYFHEGEKNSERIDKLMPYLTVFLTLWWGIGVVSCTFDGPFEDTGNGFFACWISLFLSIYSCQIAVSKFGKMVTTYTTDSRRNPQQRIMAMIFVMSIGEAYSCLLQMDEINESTTDKASPQELWGLSCSLISAGLIIIFLLLRSRVNRLNDNPGVLAYFLIPWWLFGAGVVTFDTPFTATSNGYFCAWGCFCLSCYLLYLAQTERTTHIVRRLSKLGSDPVPI